MSQMTGGCQCGRIRYTVDIDSYDASVCHCRMCQRATGGVYAALTAVKRAAVTWKREPDYYASSKIARRGFCRDCGTPLTFEYVEGSDNLDLTVGSFDAPYRFKPTVAFGIESRHKPWLDVRELDGINSDDYAPLAAKWEAAGGKPA